MFVVLVIGFGLAIAFGTTRRATAYGASGMTAGMAAMMASMGTGLSIGYAAGLLWHLGWANLLGVVAGGLHGLWMGRRWGPMAALDGAGGGVMGGLMGPMLAVMLLYLPTSLMLTAILMLALQLAFAAGGLYLVAAAAGAPTGRGWFGLLGRVLGAEAPPSDADRDHYAVLGLSDAATTDEIAQAFLAETSNPAENPVRAGRAATAFAVLSDPVRRARYDAARREDLACCAPRPADTSGAGIGGEAAGKRPRGRRAREEQARRVAAATRAGRREIIGQGAALGVAALALLATGRQFEPFPASAAVSSPFSVRAAAPAAPAQPSDPAVATGQPPTPAPSEAGAAPAQAPAGDTNATPTPAPLPRLPGTAPTEVPAPPPAAAAPAGEVQQVAMTLQNGRYGPELVEVQRGVPVRLTIKAIGDPG